MAATTKRTRRTDEEIAADLEAKLAEVRNRSRVKDQKRLAVLNVKRGELSTRIGKLTAQVEAIDDETVEIQERLNKKEED